MYIDIINYGCGSTSCTVGALVSGCIHMYVNCKLENIRLIFMCMLIQKTITEYILIAYDMIYLLSAIGLTPSGSSTVHIYT
jgi:hypothetical protein